MRITLCGAAGEVTGSAYFVQTASATVLVDCGMFQGHGATVARNRELGPINPQRLDAVVLTHAHLDHTGRLPLLTRGGYRQPIFATPATFDFTRLILVDSAQLQKSDAERKNRKNPHRPPAEPLYTRADVDALTPLGRPVNLGQSVDVAPGVSIRYYEAGHILGSTSVEMTVTEGGTKRVVVFSGDLGPLGSPILNDFDPPRAADLVFQETTYGNRDHRPLAETVSEFRGILKDAVERRKKILIPSFAIGRSQVVIYHIAEAVRDGVIPPIPIHLDSPMGVEASQHYLKYRELLDAEASAHIRRQDLSATLDRLHFVRSADESKALNALSGPMAIIAGSGMCDGGRIVHHLRQNLPSPNTAVIIVGYQTPGSLGRRLVDRAKEVRIFGQPVPVRASIHTLGGFSGHAGQSDLITWASRLAPSAPTWVLTHGELGPREDFWQVLQSRLGIAAKCPQFHDVIELN